MALPNVFQILRSLYLCTCNDFKVIIIPHTIIVGVLSALTGGLLTRNDAPSALAIWRRLPIVLLWNWINLLVFNIVNQRKAESIMEDKVNKPWRPIVSGLLSPQEAQNLIIALIPIGLFISHHISTLVETLLMLVLTWIYNDLGDGSDHFAIRNGLNGFAFALHTYAATLIAANNYISVNDTQRIALNSGLQLAVCRCFGCVHNLIGTRSPRHGWRDDT
ncbi:hypothetical protein F5Y03DRAFT_291459 [Xylaria venustula]|nr:hypothetical protein F5Y03DRAFT_291459 [Xylaria venustula]